jgi:hypothetical protein
MCDRKVFSSNADRCRIAARTKVIASVTSIPTKRESQEVENELTSFCTKASHLDVGKPYLGWRHRRVYATIMSIEISAFLRQYDVILVSKFACFKPSE